MSISSPIDFGYEYPEFTDEELREGLSSLSLVFAEPTFDTAVVYRDRVDIYCNQMMCSIGEIPDITVIVMNPMWMDIYEEDEDEFIEMLIRGFDHEHIHQTFFRMQKFRTSGWFDLFSGEISEDDYTGAATEKALKKWQSRMIRKHPYDRRVRWHD